MKGTKLRLKLGMKVSIPRAHPNPVLERQDEEPPLLIWILVGDSGFSVQCSKTREKPSPQPDMGPLVYNQAETAVPFPRTEEEKPGQEARLPHR